MPLMQEAMDKENWERMEKGLPPIRKKVEPRPEPEFPDVKTVLFKDVPLDLFTRLLDAKMRWEINKEGMKFLGFDVEIELSMKDGKEEQTEILRGWMPESEWLLFVRNARSKIDWKVVQL